MPAFLNNFHLTEPLGTDLASGIDGYILDDTKKSLNERYAVEHQPLTTPASSDSDSVTAQGRHIPGKVGVLFYGTFAEIAAISAPGEGAIGYATDLNNFYRYDKIGASGWLIFALTADTILPDNETLEVLAGGSGNVLGMKHDNQQWTTTADLIDAANIITDCDKSNSFVVTLGGNRVLDNPLNMKLGATYIWKIVQPAVGGKALTYGSAFKFPGGIVPVLSGGADAVDLIMGISDGANVVFCSVMYDVR